MINRYRWIGERAHSDLVGYEDKKVEGMQAKMMWGGWRYSIKEMRRRAKEQTREKLKELPAFCRHESASASFFSPPDLFFFYEGGNQGKGGQHRN